MCVNYCIYTSLTNMFSPNGSDFLFRSLFDILLTNFGSQTREMEIIKRSVVFEMAEDKSSQH